MAWPGILTEEEQSQIQFFVDEMFRHNILRFVQTLNTSRGIKLVWDLQINDLFLKLSANDRIPIKSGLSGCSSLSKAEIIAQLSDLSDVLSSYDTQEKFAKYIKSIGAPNMIRE